MNTCIHTPVIHQSDFVILGGGIAAMTAAVTLAERKHRVLLITKETYLLEDVSLLHFYRLKKNSDHHSMLTRMADESVRVPDQLKLRAEDLLIKAGAEYLYGAVPLDLDCNEDGTTLLRIAGKFGVNGIKCSTVMDLRYSAGFEDRMTVDVMKGPETEEELKFILPGICGSYEVRIYPGPFGSGHKIIDVPLTEGIEPEKRAIDAFDWIKKNQPGYSGVELCHFMGTGYSSVYNPDEQVERGLKAASDWNSEKYRSIPGNLRLHKEHVLVSYNTEADLDGSETIESAEPGIHVVKQCEAAVVGGGTSGAMAAIYLARQGIKTVLLELNQKLGGTGTVGGVRTYWFGKRHKETVELDERIQGYYETLGLSRKPGIWSKFDDFNPDLKSYVLRQMCEEAGVEIVFGAVSFAALAEKADLSKVSGIAAVTGSGTVAVLCKYVIDATGDGDIAAFANADYCYGSGRDAITFWASLAQYTSPMAYRNNFSSTVLISDARDFTRFITAGRRRGDNIYDHGTYVAPRESRHIRALYEITLKDTVSYKEYEDTVCTCFSNYDPKGKLDADMVYAGVLPPQNSVAVPLRAFLSVNREKRRIEGLLVGGKAFSCTHNAFPGLRMQPDMQHQGAVLGLLAAEAILNDKDIMKLDVKQLQKKITKLTGDPLKLQKGRRMKIKELVGKIHKEMRLEWTDFPFENEVLELPESIAVMTAPSHKILPFLEKRFKEEKDPDNRSFLARFILWHGSDAATDLLLKEIMAELDGQKGLPERKGSMMCVQLLPDHGIMAETVYKLNLLAWSKRTDVYKPFSVVLKKLTQMERDYRDNKKSIYHYIEAFAYVAEHTGLKAFIPMLKALLRLPEFVDAEQSDTDILAERHLILKLSLLRALARCGDIEGFEGLIELLSCSSASIGISAYMELKNLTGKSLGRIPEKWYDYIHSGRFIPSIRPVRKKVW